MENLLSDLLLALNPGPHLVTLYLDPIPLSLEPAPHQLESPSNPVHCFSPNWHPLDVSNNVPGVQVVELKFLKSERTLVRELDIHNNEQRAVVRRLPF